MYCKCQVINHGIWQTNLKLSVLCINSKANFIERQDITHVISLLGEKNCFRKLLARNVKICRDSTQGASEGLLHNGCYH